LTTGKRRHFVKSKAGPYWTAFSPEGSLFAVNTTGFELVLLDLSSGKEQRHVLSPSFIRTLAFAPDGKTLAGASDFGCVTLWDVATGKQKALSPTPIRVSRLRFVNHGKEILSIGDGDSIDLWNVSNNRLVRRLARDAHWFNDFTLSVSADAKLVAVDLAELRTKKGGYPESKLVLMDCETGAKLHALKEDKCFVSSSAFSPDGTLLFTSAAKTGVAGLSDPHVTIWEVTTGKLLRKLNTAVAVENLSVSPNGRWLAAQSYAKRGGNSIHLWEVETGKLVHRLSPFSERTHAFVFSADSLRLASVGNTTGRGFHGEVHLWDLATGKEVRTFTGHKDQVVAVAMAPDGRTLATSSWDRAVRLWEVATGKERGRITGHEGVVVSINFSPNGRILAAASGDAPVYLWNTYAVQKSKLTDANLTRKEREDLWQQLTDDASEVAFQSICE
jgi:WD40 repeat protein